MAGGWKVIDASTLTADLAFEADVAIVGTGAGGGTAAEILSAAGLTVVMVEEGPLATSSDFHMLEREAYPQLYQESAARKSRDKAINILQGRCVGGGTTVNWTSSFRTPATTLEHWASTFGLADFAEADLAPWFERVERRLNIAPWEVAPNENNDILAARRASARHPGGDDPAQRQRLLEHRLLWRRLPDQRQAVDAGHRRFPAALSNGATLLTRTRAWTFDHSGGHVTALNCIGLDARGTDPGPHRVVVRARMFVAAGGAIRHAGACCCEAARRTREGIIGKRTFLHPTVVSAALMPNRVDGYAGAPQTVYSDHFLDSLPADGPIGYKLEAPPLHPVLVATTLSGDGAAHARWMRELPRMQVLIALMRDGFHPESDGGTVALQSDGTPSLDYPLNDYFWDGARRALATMAEIQFAAGARMVMPVHGSGASYTSWSEARTGIGTLALKPLALPVVSAHVMGGCPLGPDAKRAVADTDGRHHHLDNLYVFDGSLFPTSIGANPQVSVYGIVTRLASGLAHRLAPARTAGND